MSAAPIYVTRPSLPPLAELLPYLEQIWDSRILTNAGPLHQQLEEALADYLGTPHLSLFANGTLALITALQAQGITGEVITTPYSFVATVNALRWNGLTPVFADITADGCNLDPRRIEAAITPHTTAILPVHCYATRCDVDAIQRIADRHGLKVLYDAAHAFGARDEGGSILRHGDMSILSFHATKVFNTFEGGAIICRDAQTKEKIDRLRNFGFAGETEVIAAGINGKMSELHAAVGLLQLPQIDHLIARRQAVDEAYRQRLADCPGIRLPNPPAAGQANYAYFPIFITPDYPLSRDALYERLKADNIHPRRYFYPLISDFPMYRALPSAQRRNLPNAALRADTVLCLPIYPDLDEAAIERITQILWEATGPS